LRQRSKGFGRPVVAAAILVASAALLAPTAAFAHPERQTFFPGPAPSSQSGLTDPPVYRSTDVNGGEALVICKPDSQQRIENGVQEPERTRALGLLPACQYQNIQDAVNAAGNWDRILILPGVYTEQSSLNRRQAARDGDDPNPLCNTAAQKGVLTDPLSYDEQYYCPFLHNLIAIMGDRPDSGAAPTDSDRACDQKCHIQIEGVGDDRGDVKITGSRSALNVFRADRADGIHFTNFTVEFSDFNNLYVLETNGFVYDRIVSAFSREYGFLSFTSDNGLYDHLESFGAGDSGIYPGSGPEYHCNGYGIEIRDVDSHDNTIGYSGTAGNGVWAHHNRFHGNATGMTTDSFAGGHPGSPQDCAKWENNLVYSNNKDLFNADNDAYCRDTPVFERDPDRVCPTFQVPVGTGMLIAGGNGNIIQNNRIWDNWRNGTMLHWVPANFRGEGPGADPPAFIPPGPCPSHEQAPCLIDTSFDNQQRNNLMGVDELGREDPNGTDFWWDEQGSGNCWQGNTGFGGAQPSSNVLLGLPACPGSPIFSPGNPIKDASLVPCATWDPQTNTDPPGCDWFTRPAEPQPRSTGGGTPPGGTPPGGTPPGGTPPGGTPPGGTGAAQGGPNAGAASLAQCLSRNFGISRRGIGGIRLGEAASNVMLSDGIPGARSARRFRYCVAGGGRVFVALTEPFATASGLIELRTGASAAAGPRVRLVATTARAHRARGLHKGDSVKKLRRLFPRARRVSGGLFIDRPAHRFFGVRNGRVTFIGAATRSTLRGAARLRGALKQAGLRPRL
jgi:hypothetical protein